MKLAIIVVVLFLGTATGYSLNHVRNQEEPMVHQKENVAKRADSCKGNDVMQPVACHGMDSTMNICTNPNPVYSQLRDMCCNFCAGKETREIVSLLKKMLAEDETKE
ncbi:uncharacterized protein LOC134685612 [Mytilus trossulus]|uniref:uncharacterized protein LOC134685612 n=1 Tax=Mytilus trossulus TaxID=6551 RepID=UPI00300717AF